MSKKKHPNKAHQKPLVQRPPPPVLHGDVFRTFVDEARSIGNEVVARREFDLDVVEYLRSKGLFDEWCAWRAAKRGPQT